jgi:hypothetical protein
MSFHGLSGELPFGISERIGKSSYNSWFNIWERYQECILISTEKFIY